MADYTCRDFRKAMRQLVEEAGGTWSPIMDETADNLMEALVTATLELLFSSDVMGTEYRQRLSESVRQYLSSHGHLH